MVAACLPALGAGAPGGSGRGALPLSVAAATALAATAPHDRFRAAVAPVRVPWGGALAQAGAWAVAATGRWPWWQRSRCRAPPRGRS
ncbi:hypothetical protein [Streptomyces omiyaensis]|uniref:Uncharacterized protein n=1 Tax=Streptomyces omiyaensis TaxID=68247 RepID=A0ABW7BKS8_9ACTN|nr:hypothetical protein [Streptomyces omiyaensis]GGY54879.1 hypothetical protein GCM10010363_40220 [Streptomyces omiyaensis]